MACSGAPAAPERSCVAARPLRPYPCRHRRRRATSSGALPPPPTKARPSPRGEPPSPPLRAAWRCCRLASKRDFHEPASLRAATSAQRSSSQRASAASARARSRSARTRSRSYSDWKSRGGRAVPAEGEGPIAARALGRPQIRGKIVVAHDHAHDDSAWRNMLPAPLRAPIPRRIWMLNSGGQHGPTEPLRRHRYHVCRARISVLTMC